MHPQLSESVRFEFEETRSHLFPSHRTLNYCSVRWRVFAKKHGALRQESNQHCVRGVQQKGRGDPGTHCVQYPVSFRPRISAANG